MSRTITVVGIEVEKQVDDFLKNLDGTRQDAPEALLQKLRQMPSLYRRFYLKALTGKSRRGAMKVHCLECAGWNPGEVARCESVSCALWAYRAYKKGQFAMRVDGHSCNGNAAPTRAEDMVSKGQ